jgi:hypothetical protein
MSHLRVNLKI